VERVRKEYCKAFDDKFEELLKFKEEHGHCKVPRSYPNNLGHWVNKIRQRKHRRSKEEILRLDSIGFVWSMKK
jgi:hypothetical protein